MAQQPDFMNHHPCSCLLRNNTRHSYLVEPLNPPFKCNAGNSFVLMRPHQRGWSMIFSAHVSSSSSSSSSQRRTMLCCFVQPIIERILHKQEEQNIGLEIIPKQDHCSLLVLLSTTSFSLILSSFSIALTPFLRTNTPLGSYESMGHLSPK